MKRRTFLASLASLVAFFSSPPAGNTGALEDDVVIVNGWIVRRSQIANRLVLQ